MDRDFIWKVLGVVGTVFLGLQVIGLVGDWYADHLVCMETNKIAKIGACDDQAYCGVQFYNGSYGESFRPVQDQEVCTQSKFKLSAK